MSVYRSLRIIADANVHRSRVLRLYVLLLVFFYSRKGSDELNLKKLQLYILLASNVSK